jgi:hypothetical protein
VSRRLLVPLLLFLAACGGGEKKARAVYELSREPVSVRGWILDTKGSQHQSSPDLEIARRTQLFASTSVWVENSQYSSGGVAENGAFIILDVPPNDSVIGFNAPGAETAKIVLKGIPGSADVVIPDVILERGGATVFDPAKIRIRLPSRDVKQATPTGKTATIAGYTVPIVFTPLSEMTDRRDYPDPGGFRPIAIVR